jgi:hypothetical protein
MIRIVAGRSEAINRIEAKHSFTVYVGVDIRGSKTIEQGYKQLYAHKVAIKGLLTPFLNGANISWIDTIKNYKIIAMGFEAK